MDTGRRMARGVDHHLDSLGLEDRPCVVGHPGGAALQRIVEAARGELLLGPARGRERLERLLHVQVGDDSDVEAGRQARLRQEHGAELAGADEGRSEEHTSELQSLMRISYAVFCLKKK